jgi:hypothetical protein
MSFKEVLPAFIWAGVVVGATSLAVAWLWSENEVNDGYNGGDTFVVASPYGR